MTHRIIISTLKGYKMNRLISLLGVLLFSFVYSESFSQPNNTADSSSEIGFKNLLVIGLAAAGDGKFALNSPQQAL